jgi:hypothetical protein
MTEHRGDKFVWYVCLFITGALFGTWLTPEPRFAACIEIPKQSQRLPVTKAEKSAFIQYYSNRGM